MEERSQQSVDLASQPPPPLPEPPPHESFVVRALPGPVAAAGPVPLAAAAGAGVLVAGLVPWGVGLGWLLAGAAVCAATAIGIRFAGVGPPPADWRRRVESLAWGAAALVLLAVGALRAAEWLFGLCLFAAAVATALAVTGGRTVRGLAVGALLIPAAAWRGIAWAYRGTGGFRSRVRPTFRIVPTIAITVLVLLVFGALLASADAAFSRLLTDAVPDADAGAVVGWLLRFAAGAALVVAAVFLLLAPPKVDRPQPVRREVRLVEWAVPVGALVALFAGFVGVQLTVLFGGASYVLGPDGPTYAEHARGGFWQLLAVTALTLVVIGIAAWVAPRRKLVERACLRGLVGALAAMTLLIVASALFRMHTYQEAYGFTRLRVLVSIVELWLGLVFVLVLVAGVRLRAGWLPRAMMATGVVAVLALAALNPDRFIAERNLDRWANGEQLDVAYLASLSADAVPALVCLPESVRPEALAEIRADLAGSPDHWQDANLSRASARSRLGEAEPGSAGACTSAP